MYAYDEHDTTTVNEKCNKLSDARALTELVGETTSERKRVGRKTVGFRSGKMGLKEQPTVSLLHPPPVEIGRSPLRLETT